MFYIFYIQFEKNKRKFSVDKVKKMMERKKIAQEIR